MKDNKLCQEHNEDIQEMRAEIDSIKDSLKLFNVKLDKLFDSIKPAFTIKDKLTFIVGLVVYTVVVSTSFNTVDNRSIENEKKIDKIESKMDKIYDLVYEMYKKGK